MEDNFYITLSSTASLQYYPENTASDFKVALAQPIHLEGDWLCGLSAIHYPNNISALNEGTLIISGFPHKRIPINNENFEPILKTFPYNARGIQQGYVIKTERPKAPLENNKDKSFDRSLLTLDGGKYSFTHTISTVNQTSVIATGESFLQMLNTVLQSQTAFGGQLYQRKIASNTDMRFPIEFKSQGNGGGFEIIIRDEDLQLLLPASVARILGFALHDKQYLELKGKGRFSYAFQNIDLEANKPRSFHFYSGIIAPQFVGDSLVPSLKVIPIPIKATSSANELASSSYNVIQYVPVSNKAFSIVETQLRDNTGQLLNFTYGQTIAVIHFLKREKKK